MARHSTDEPETRRERLHLVWERHKVKIAAALAALLGVAVGGGAWAYAAPSATTTLGIVCGSAKIDPTTGKVNIPCTVNGLPAPSTSPSPTPSTSPSPSPSPSGSPTPSPTTTSPTPSPSPSTSSSGPCPVAGKNMPGAADPWGGCWPGPGNTGVPAGVTLTDYTGPCTITVAGTVIDGKHVTCATLSIQAAGVVLKNSWFDGTDIEDGDSGAASFTIADSKVSNGARDQCACIGYHDFTATRVEVIGGNRSMYCESHCTITDSWLHGQQLQGAQHGSGLREEQYTTASHNAIACDYPYWNDTTTLGCSAALTGYADFAPIHDNTIYRNLFLSSPAASYCNYGGNSGGKPYSSDPANGTHQVFTGNVYQRGATGLCASYGPVTDFNLSGAGNVFSGTWDSGGTISAA